ncbi:dual specificity mitogen-activated protein kinase kinase 7-like [Paramacrobiotus metropolitanus]|uniref:dual specificity mitogen-activated protein kinase kinase 7-like n=1 Tax=Paramacrobiotus metropolitanus TaxID=2943436 RepID=UPI002445E615|nr:dual specificity mitogen-activated protein kinase kinase 7-like [Paramacrobiotus metropolitanus]
MDGEEGLDLAAKIRDLDKRIQAENQMSENGTFTHSGQNVQKPPLNFNLLSPSVTRKKVKPLLMTSHTTVGPALGRAITPDMENEAAEPSLLGFRDSFRLTRQRRLELASSALPPGVFQNAAISSAKTDDHQIEYEEKLGEIMKKTNIITIRGMKYESKIDDLENLGELGHGTCGTVVRMRFKKTGDILAVKIMRKSGNREENKRIIRDLDVVLKSHDCPHIVQCVGCFVTDAEVWICMEMMTTCLEKLIQRTHAPVPEKILGKMTVSVLKALDYLKEIHGVIHRDVKPSNILLDSKGTFKLCDFGISGRLVDSKAKTRCAGCVAYMAPERICPADPNRPDYDIRADVWSFGISLVELATGELPYKNCKTDFEVLTRIIEDAPPSLPAHRGYSMDFCAFVKDCLTKDYKRRPKYRKLLDHPFVVRYELLNVDVASWLKNLQPRLLVPLAFQNALLSSPSPTAALPPHAPPKHTTTTTPTSAHVVAATTPQSAPQTPQKSWFVKQATKSIFRSAANVPSTAPLPRKQYNMVNNAFF